MSVVAGILKIDGSNVDAADLKRMNTALSVRDQDDSGVWLDGPIGLSQSSLWNTPESRHEKYPLLSQDGHRVLVADVRLDNRDELIRVLGCRDDGSTGDGALLLRAHEKWGEACAENLIGDFAFAIWNKKERTLFCARDVFGVRPLCFYQSDHFFIFSSEIKGILAVSEVPRQLDENKMADYLLWSQENPQRTFYRDIWRLAPAHSKTIHIDGKSVLRRFWSLNPDKELHLDSDEAYAERFREIFTEAVRCRLRSIGPVGAFLSGGLDSSAVAAVARNLLIQRGGLDVFSAVFENVPSSDERPFIREISSRDGVRPHFIPADGIAPFFEIEEQFKRLDETHHDDLTMNWGGIYPEAKKMGVRVLLDGDGGDEVVFRGYLRLAELLSQFRFIEYFKTWTGLSKNIDRSLGDLFLSQSLRPLIPPALLYAWRVLRWGNRPLWFDQTLLNPVFAQRIGIREREARQIKLETRPFKTVKEDHFSQLTSGSIPYTFQIMAPAAAAFGIEHRYPFHDQRLAEYCLALPSDQKCYRGWTRIVMRRALKGILPESIRWRGGKTYLTDDFVYRLNRFEKETLDRLILHESSHLEPYYDMNVLRKKYKLFLAQPKYETAIILWQAAMLSFWIKQSGISQPKT